MLARTTWYLALSAVAALALPARAAEEPPAQTKQGIHIVRPGDTLENLAEIYLGSARRWPEIAQLNPGIGDPKHLQPGRRLNILIGTGGTFAAAQIASLSNQVEERPAPIPWGEAKQHDFLVEQDGVRTHKKSSAEMRFGDGTRLLVTEDSLVFLRRSGERLKGVPRKSIEIVEGQAEVAAQRPKPAAGRAGAAAPGVEILLGKTRATARPNSEGISQARARHPSEGGAKVMLYGGAGEVEAGGAKVAVAEGMGTSVGKEGPPSPPEKLLPAPAIASPLATARMEFANPVFTWAAVPEAAAYIVELCKDAGCGVLMDRILLEHPAPEPEWQPRMLPIGTLYWRVTARSHSGLDGYPSAPASLEIQSDRLDHEKPVAKLALTGRQIEVNGKLFVGPGIGLELAAEDTGCGILTSAPSVDGATDAPGEHRAGGHAVDLCGNRTEAPPVVFTVDVEAPTVKTGIVERSILGLEGEPKAVRRSGRRGGEPAGIGLFWSSDGRRWLPLWRPAEATAHAANAVNAANAAKATASRAPDEIASDRPRLFLRMRGVRLTIDGQTVAPGDDQLLSVTAEDAGAGVERLRFQLAPGSGGSGSGAAPVLAIEVVDLVGNSRQLSWPLLLP
jgi:hypothetical protein